MAIAFQSFGKGLLFKFEVLGEKQVVGLLPGILERIKDFRPLGDPIDEIMRKDVKETFEKEGEGRLKWQDLAPSTVISRIRRGFPGEHPILVNTGWLKESFINKGHPKHILDKHRQYIEFGSTVEYAVYHQSPEARTRLPRRPIVYLVTKTIANLIQAIRKHILKEGGR
jgi:phage gpG-like protein